MADLVAGGALAFVLLCLDVLLLLVVRQRRRSREPATDQEGGDASHENETDADVTDADEARAAEDDAGTGEPSGGADAQRAAPRREAGHLRDR